MSLCSSSCNAAVPRWSGGCNIVKRDGGISNLIFISCNFRFASTGYVTVVDPLGVSFSVGVITDWHSWAAGVQHNMIRPSPVGIGEKPESTFTLAKFASCLPEEIESETHLVNFQSFDTDPVNYYDRTYWNTIRTNYIKYHLMYLGCNDLVHYTGDVTDPGFAFTPTVLGYVKPPAQENKDFYQANLSFLYSGIPAMINVVNLDEALNIDVNS